MPALQFSVALRVMRAGEHVAGLPQAPGESKNNLSYECGVVADDRSRPRCFSRALQPFQRRLLIASRIPKQRSGWPRPGRAQEKTAAESRAEVKASVVRLGGARTPALRVGFATGLEQARPLRTRKRWRDDPHVGVQHHERQAAIASSGYFPAKSVMQSFSQSSSQ